MTTKYNVSLGTNQDTRPPPRVAYSINLVAQQVTLRHRRIAMLSFVTISLLVFAMLLVATFGLYLRRDHQLTVAEGKIRLLLDRMEKTTELNPQEVAHLRTQSRNLDASLKLLARIVDGATPWPEIIACLVQCGHGKGIQLEMVESQVSRTDRRLAFEAVCIAEQPMSRMQEFMNELQAHPTFKKPELVSVKGGNGAPLTVTGHVRLVRHAPEPEAKGQGS